LLASLGNKSTPIVDQNEFLAHFDEIFDKGVRREILNATDKDVWGNRQGVTVGFGTNWFDGIIPPRPLS
jgi:hypothetical protein